MKSIHYQFLNSLNRGTVTFKCLARDLTVSNGRIFLRNECIAEMNHLGFWIYEGKRYTDFSIAGP